MAQWYWTAWSRGRPRESSGRGIGADRRYRSVGYRGLEGASEGVK
jgi:hypothetical protein